MWDDLVFGLYQTNLGAGICDADDLVPVGDRTDALKLFLQCPVDPTHKVKRKRLPFHVTECKKQFGKGRLSCSYSKYHFFADTKEELARHEMVCKMRYESDVRPAPIPEPDPVGITISPLVLAANRARNPGSFSSFPNWNQTETLASAGDSHARDLISEATKVYLPLLDSLTKTCLFSYYRETPLLTAPAIVDKTIGGLTMPVLQEQDEEEHQFGEPTDGSEGPPGGTQNHRVFSDHALMELNYSREDFVNEDSSSHFKPAFLSDDSYRSCVQMGRGRWEDERDAMENPKKFVPDFSQYPHSFRKKLAAKFRRDVNIYRTGQNPCYDKTLDVQGADVSGQPHPLEFQEFAAFYEDILYAAKPSQWSKKNVSGDESTKTGT